MGNKLALTVVLALLQVLLADGWQRPEATAAKRAEVIQAAREVMEKARYCALITVDDDGQPQARVVDPFAPEEDLTVWIATKPVTRKVGQITKDPRVTLFYFDPEGLGYVTLLGKADIVKDPVEKAKRWKEDWSAFYDDRNRGDDYLLIRVTPSRLEIMSFGHGLLNDPKTWRPVTIDLR